MRNTLTILSILLSVACFSVSAQTFPFAYTGGMQTWTVPAGVTSITIDAQGASGGTSGGYFNSGGCGGRVQCTLAVTAGQVLNIFVGGQGAGGYYSGGLGGYNGGGAGGTGYFAGGGGGGGATDIRIGGVAPANRVVTAGGGAGAGDDIGGETGGDGGGPAAAGNGLDGGTYFASTCGAGATSLLAGAGATLGGTSGLLLTGGDGGGGFFNDGGGGGGGQYGGGGGYAGGGGGGSSYTDAILCTGVVHTQGYNCFSDGTLTITACVPPVAGAIVGPTTICTGSTGSYANPTSSGTLSWSSSNVAVLTIGSTTGVATGVSAGTCNIICTATTGCGTVTATFPVTVTVTPGPITAPVNVCVGDTVTLTDGTPGGSWSSVSTAFGTVNPVSGLFGGVATGSTVIHYTLGTCVASATINVISGPAAIAGAGSVCIGGTLSLSDGTLGGTWSSVLPGVASISGTGTVTGNSLGTTVISYAVGGCAATAVVTVTPVPGPILGPDSVCVGTFTSLSDVVTGGTWTSLSPAIGTVDAFGNVTGIAPGNATIKYTLGTCFVTVVVTVHPVPGAIVGPDSICIGSSVTYTDPTPGGVWSSLAPAFIPVTPAGVATALTVGGSTDIVYSISGCVAFKFVGVQDSARQITGASEVCVGGSITLAEAALGGIWSTHPSTFASVSPSGFFGIVTALSAGVDTILYTKPYCPIQRHVVTVNPLPASISGTTAVCIGLGTTLSDPTPGGLWSSSNPLATVSPAGVVTCTVVGLTDTIYYTLPTGCSTFAVVNVGTAPPGILPLHPSICQGAMDTLYDADPTHSGVWSSTSLAIAQVIDSSGVVTGISSGSVIISYTWPNGCYATDSFTVKPLIPASVTITGPTGLVCSGDSITFVAHPVNGGTPTYIWKKFSTIPFASTADTLKYPPTHGDVIMCYMTTHGICSVMDSVVDTFAVNVYPDSIAPVVTIMTAHSDSISYIGEIVTFNASVTWTGTITSYQWKVNNVAISGATNSSFALPVYSNDTVQCIVNGNPLCPASPLLPGVSNSIAIRAGYEAVGNVTQNTGSYTLFPNPNSGTFTLSGSVGNNSGKEVSYEISNVLGQVVYRGTAIPQNGMIREQVQLGNDAPGSYQLRVSSEAGSQTFHFVISK